MSVVYCDQYLIKFYKAKNKCGHKITKASLKQAFKSEAQYRPRTSQHETTKQRDPVQTLPASCIDLKDNQVQWIFHWNI